MNSRDLVNPGTRQSVYSLSGTYTVCAAILALAISSPLHAVHLKGNIELDGNTANDGAAVAGIDDWDDVFANSDNATRSVFVFDSAALDPTTYSGGQKDTQSLNNWTCTRATVQNKSDILHAYAALYLDEGELLLYAGADREGNLGTANMGVWLFQNAVACESPGGATPFTGTHLDGDLLVVAEFDQGGRVEALQVYRWSDPDGTPQSGDECLGGGAGDCSDAGQAYFTGLNCNDSNPGDLTCGRTNPVSAINAAWRNNIPTQGMLEMGINLSTLIESTGCFANVIIETRSSTALNATLKDFVSLELSSCANLTVSKTTQGGDGEFGFDISPSAGGPDAFELSDGESQVFPNASNGEYTIAENSLPGGPAPPFGWSLVDISCTGGDAGTPIFVGGGSGGGEISLELVESDDAECTFTNQFTPPPGSITIQKICDSVGPAGQEFAFTLTGFGGSSTAACADGSEGLACGEAITCLGLGAGGYSVNEAAVAGWELSTVDCEGTATCGEGLSPHASITLGANDDAVVTFTNTEEATIQICKETVPASAGGDFGFSGDLGAFSLADSECSTPAPVTPDQAYDITESAEAAFLLAHISCSGFNWIADAAGSRTVTVAPDAGEEVTCTFTNIEDPGYIRVCKETLSTTDLGLPFEIVLNGPTAGLPVSTSLADGECDFGALDPGALPLPMGSGYSVTETPTFGWIFSVSCQGSEGAEDPQSIELDAGESVVCTFTNDLLSPAPTVAVPVNTSWFLALLLLGVGLSGLYVLRKRWNRP